MTFEWKFRFNTTYTFEPIIPFQLNFIINYSNILKCINLIEIQFLHAYFYIPPFLVFWHIMFDTTRAPDKLRICIFYAIKTSKNACIIRSECTHYAYILLCKQTFQIRSVLAVVYITIHFCLWEIPRNYFFILFEGESVYIWGVPNVCLSKHQCQKRSDWMFRINITNKCSLRNK